MNLVEQKRTQIKQWKMILDVESQVYESLILIGDIAQKRFQSPCVLKVCLLLLSQTKEVKHRS